MPAASHGVLTPDQITSVQVDAGPDGVVVVNRSLTGTIWVTVDGSDPDDSAANSFSVLGARDFQFSRYRRQSGPIVVKLIAGEALAYSVEAIG